MNRAGARLDAEHGGATREGGPHVRNLLSTECYAVLRAHREPIGFTTPNKGQCVRAWQVGAKATENSEPR